MDWAAFAQQAPALAAFGEERFAGTGTALLGTLRRDGWPRISPVEIHLIDGHLYRGMEWRTLKALDLMRDPRITVHSVFAGRQGAEGEFMVFGRATDVRSPARRVRFGAVVSERRGEPFTDSESHLFEVDIESATSVTIEDGERSIEMWKAD